jgi:amino acid transporter
MTSPDGAGAPQPPKKPAAKPSRNVWLRMSPMPRAIGLVLAFVGIVYVLMGLDIAGDSQYRGNMVFTIGGAAAALAGLVVLHRTSQTAKRQIQAEIDAEERAKGE